jgi:hypothetical protein
MFEACAEFNPTGGKIQTCLFEHKCWFRGNEASLGYGPWR